MKIYNIRHFHIKVTIKMKMQSSNLKMRTLIYIGTLPVMMFKKNQWRRFVGPVVFDGIFVGCLSDWAT